MSNERKGPINRWKRKKGGEVREGNPREDYVFRNFSKFQEKKRVRRTVKKIMKREGSDDGSWYLEGLPPQTPPQLLLPEETQGR